MADFICFRNNDFNENNMQTDPVALNTHRLVSRIQELEDLVIELKSKQNAQEVTELRQLLSQVQLENLNMIQMVKYLQKKRLESKELFSANEMHQSYLGIMKEREKIIEKLHL